MKTLDCPDKEIGLKENTIIHWTTILHPMQIVLCAGVLIIAGGVTNSEYLAVGEASNDSSSGFYLILIIF